MNIQSAETEAIREIRPNGTVRFEFNGTDWVVATDTIDLLLVNSPQVNQILGESAAKIRILESMNIANLAAENSNAKVYFRAAGFFTFNPNVSSIKYVPPKLKNTSSSPSGNLVQIERNLIGADGVLYQGAETKDACGLGTLSARDANNLVAVQQYTCTLNVAAYAKGFSHPLLNTMLYRTDSLKNIPFYSSPLVYESKYGIRLGDAETADSTRRINEMAPILAAFR